MLGSWWLSPLLLVIVITALLCPEPLGGFNVNSCPKPPNLPSRRRRSPILFSQSSPSDTPLRIGVLGGGITGYALAISLLSPLTSSAPSRSLEVTIFEAAPDRAAMGGGVQLNGGLAALRTVLDDKSFRELEGLCVRMRGVESYSSHNSPPGSAAARLLSLNVTDAMVRKAPELILPGDPPFASSVTVLRSTLLDFMRGAAAGLPSPPALVPEKVSSVKSSEDGVTLETSSGSRRDFDLVVGCDGIRSIAKEHVEGREDVGIYSGLRILYGVSPGKDGGPSSSTLTQHFGSGGYALRGDYGCTAGRTKSMAALVYPGPRTSENPDWTADSDASLASRLKARGIPTGDFDDVLSSPDTVFTELGVYFHSPFSKWRNGHGNVMLAGDAAHAMPPFLGQGANQGLQDGVLLGKLIRASDGTDLTPVADEFRKSRWLQTTQITLKSVFLGYLETGDGWLGTFRDNFFRFAGAVGLAEYVFLDGARPVPSLNVEARGGSRSADVLDKVKLLVQVIQDPTQFMDDE